MGRAVASLKAARVEAHRRRAVAASAAVHMLHRGLGKAMRALRDSGIERGRKLALAESAASHLLCRQLSRALCAWRAAVNDHESRVERFAARLAMGRGLYAFAEAARASGRVRRALSRMRQRALCGALLSLQESASEARRKRGVASAAVARLVCRSQATAFSTLKAHLGETRRKRGLAASAAQSLLHRCLRRAMATLREAHAEAAEARRLRGVAAAAAARMIGHRMGRAVASLKAARVEAHRRRMISTSATSFSLHRGLAFGLCHLKENRLAARLACAAAHAANARIARPRLSNALRLWRGQVRGHQRRLIVARVAALKRRRGDLRNALYRWQLAGARHLLLGAALEKADVRRRHSELVRGFLAIFTCAPGPPRMHRLSATAQRWLDEVRQAVKDPATRPAKEHLSQALDSRLDYLYSLSRSSLRERSPSTPRRRGHKGEAARSGRSSCSKHRPQLAPHRVPPLTVGALLDEMQRFLDVRKWTVKELFRNRSVNLSNRAAGDFALSAAELCAFLSSPEVGLRLSPSDARALIADIDTSGNGELEASELDKALRARKAQRNREEGGGSALPERHYDYFRGAVWLQPML